MSPDRTRPPVPATPRPFDFPDWQAHRLANGVRLMVIAEPRVPMVHLELLLRGGAESDPLVHRGLTAFAGNLLDEGTERRGSTEIADEVELLGASLYTSGDWDGVYVGVAALSQHLPRLFALTAEVLRAPSFPPREIERVRAMRLADLANRSSHGAFVAGRHAVELVYGPDHPYGDSVLGTEETLAAIEAEHFHAWHRRCARPELATVVAAGDTTLDEIASLAEEYLGDWVAPPAATLPAAGPPSPPAGRRVRIVDRPRSEQTDLRLARAGLPRNSPGYLAARLINLMLGGKFTSRLNLNLRERLGITYGVQSRLSRRRGPGPFSVGCAVDSEAAGVAVEETLGELDRMREEAPTAEEVADARSYLLGTFPYRLQTLEGQADHLAEIALHDLAPDHFRTLPERLAHVGDDDLRACGRSLLETADLAIVAVGPATVLRPQLERFGPLEVTSDDPAGQGS